MDNISMADLTKRPWPGPKKSERAGGISRPLIVAITLVSILIFTEGVGLVYFINKSQGLSKQLKTLTDLKPNYEKLTEGERLLKSEYEALSAKFKAIQEDRDNLAVRAKGLLAETAHTKELQDTIEKLKSEKLSLNEDIDRVHQERLDLKDEIEKLKKRQLEIAAERDNFKLAYQKIQSHATMATVKELKGDIAVLRNEKTDLEKRLEQTNKDLQDMDKELTKELNKLTQQSSQLASEKQSLIEQLNQSKQQYAEAAAKNKALEAHINNMPEKFSEVSRQNQRLLDETAKMHYNLGVFYTKSKEYGRAITEFNKAVDINPQDSYSHFNLGYIYAEHLTNRAKAIDHFRRYLSLAKTDDKDVDWVKKYLLMWEAYEGNISIK